MDVRVHRLVAGDKPAVRGVPRRHAVCVCCHRLAFTRQQFEVSAVLLIVRMLLHPPKFILREGQRLRIMCRLVCSGRAVESEAFAVHLFVIRVQRRDRATVIDAPDVHARLAPILADEDTARFIL